jgi:hypothetical protein
MSAMINSSVASTDSTLLNMCIDIEQGAILATRFQILGWVLFIVSAMGFIASSLKSGDMLGLIGGGFFLVACFVFLIPYGLPAEKR